MFHHYLTPLSLPVLLASAMSGQAAEASLNDLLAQHVQLAQDSSALLSQVTDKQSAQQAVEPLHALVARFAVISKAMNQRAVLSDSEALPLRQQYERPLRESWGKVYQEIYRIQKKQSYGSNDFVQAFQLFCKLLDQ